MSRAQKQLELEYKEYCEAEARMTRWQRLCRLAYRICSVPRNLWFYVTYRHRWIKTFGHAPSIWR